jgi:hypothetical protein
LEKESGGDRRSILSEKEKKSLIVGFIRKRARTDAANYREVQENIESKSGKSWRGGVSEDLEKNSELSQRKRNARLPPKVCHCDCSVLILTRFTRIWGGSGEI